MTIDCVRARAISDPADLYRSESHTCFLCGAEWDPDPARVCAACNWLRCPSCNGCACLLSPRDREWLANVRATYCHDLARLASFNPAFLPATENPHLHAGIAMQLRFCRRYARGLGELLREKVQDASTDL